MRWPGRLLRGDAAKPHADPHPAVHQEFDASCLKCRLYRAERAFARAGGIVLDQVERDSRESGAVGECGLRPLQQAARGADLGGGDHRAAPYQKAHIP